MSDADAPPFYRVGPDPPTAPVLLSVPHAGRLYSPALIAASRLPRDLLESLEDRLADRLIEAAVEAGATALVATAPRAEIDLNRDEREIEPALIAPPLPAGATLPTVRSRGGIGLIPSRINGHGAIWKMRIDRAELERRLETVHRPYHRALASLLAAVRARFGAALLLDCHSMPPRVPGSGEAMIVFGDRHGASCAPDLVEAAMAAARAHGFSVARNVPYAGGHIARLHGRPDRAVHALQMEIDRSTYLDLALREPGPGLAAVTRMVADVVAALHAQLLGGALALAAE